MKFCFLLLVVSVISVVTFPPVRHAAELNGYYFKNDGSSQHSWNIDSPIPTILVDPGAEINIGGIVFVHFSSQIWISRKGKFLHSGCVLLNSSSLLSAGGTFNSKEGSCIIMGLHTQMKSENESEFDLGHNSSITLGDFSLFRIRNEAAVQIAQSSNIKTSWFSFIYAHPRSRLDLLQSNLTLGDDSWRWGAVLSLQYNSSTKLVQVRVEIKAIAYLIVREESVLNFCKTKLTIEFQSGLEVRQGSVLTLLKANVTIGYQSTLVVERQSMISSFGPAGHSIMIGVRSVLFLKGYCAITGPIVVPNYSHYTEKNFTQESLFCVETIAELLAFLQLDFFDD